MFATVYKVVRCYPEGLVSAIVSGEWGYVYPIGEEIYPRIGYFYAFLTECQGQDFLRKEYVSQLQLWECEAETVDVEPLMWDVSSLEDNGVWFWEHYEIYRVRSNHQAPPGTVWCKSIQLQRRIA